MPAPNEINVVSCPTGENSPPENKGEISLSSNDLETGATGKWRPTLADLDFRKEMAERLAEAISEAHPDDACQLMTAALFELSPDGPRSSIFLSAEDDAQWWASIATPPQLAAMLAATLKALGQKALHLELRKRLFLRLWGSFPADNKARFIAYAKGQVH